MQNINDGEEIDLTNLEPLSEETPAQYAERLGIYYTSKVSNEHKKDLGQFFTPLSVAKFMSEFAKTEQEKVRILDPGCGIGILSASLIEALIKSRKVIAIELVAFETDINILPLAELSYTYLGKWLKNKGVYFTFFLCKNDFILHNSHVLTSQEKTHELYEIIISNPPYFKLSKDDERAVAAKSVIYGQTNIYSIFLLIAAKLLSGRGQLIFITPRSFCSGSYFRLFREIFFSVIDIKAVHLFNSRKDAFKRDKVLQENIIVTAMLKSPEDNPRVIPLFNDVKKITLSTSAGISDINSRRSKEYNWESLIDINSYQKILHLPASEVDEKVIAIFKTWTGSLSLYNLKISTGPVVDFRSDKMISFKKTSKTVPLVWLHNVEPMNLVWPKIKEYKGKPKGQYIILNEASCSRLVPNKNYVLLRRFSSKDDNRRLVAAPYFSKPQSQEVLLLGLENHLNYIYHKSRELTRSETLGLAAILNSKLFDLYFRTFNGNINVSATELRDFPLPSFELIVILGTKIEANGIDQISDIDSLLAEIFNLTIDLSNIYG